MRIFVICLAFILNGKDVFAQQNDFELFEQTVENVNTFNPALAPGSRGSIGSHVSVVYQRFSISESNELISKIFGTSEKEEISFQKMSWTKGTRWPLDFSISLGQDEGHTLTDWHAFAQWTVFEKIFWPTVSIRSFYKQLYNFSEFNSTQTGLEISSGYSFLRYFTVYGSAGFARTRTTFRNVVNSETLGLTYDLNKPLEQISVDSPVVRYGLSVRPYIHFLQLNIEKETRNEFPSYSISLGY